MTGRGRRLGLLGLGLLVALAAAVPALAAINPTLDATTQASGTTIGYAQGANDEGRRQRGRSRRGEARGLG
jgi:hypothetical protein